MQPQIKIFDSTLRDGAQAEGISFSVRDKLEIVRLLDDLGVHYIEAGNPASNPKELEFFRQAAGLRLHSAKLCAFGSTRRKGIAAKEDGNCGALLAAGTPAVAVFGKSSLLHVHEILRTTPHENLRMIEDTCRFFAARGKEVIFDAEHFFDGYALDEAYAVETLRAAARGGASCLALCDTNGGAFPWKIAEAVRALRAQLRDVPAELGIHTHDDGGMAVASACAAVQAGATQVQGTFLGFGERVGNANLSAIIPNLQLKLGFACLHKDQLRALTQTALQIASVANVSLHKNMPFVGASAFAHKAGMHADGVIKNAGSFEHIDPAQVGNRRRFLMSEVAGKAAVLPRVQKIFPGFDEANIAQIVTALKAKEFEGYSFEGADASFDLLIRKSLGDMPTFFGLVNYKVLDELPYDRKSATATVKLLVDEKLKIAAAEGEGPVNALDTALREALNDFYPALRNVQLLDYKVRIMESTVGTSTKVRVLITSGDSRCQWTTVGVSHDMIEASWEALADSIVYFLLREQAGDEID
ncbi:MAG: citramalate synthase [Oscillospiraceae bacterium]|jgi:2-isopropylmalate synthase|nr:citramalate synthase [Oscillospiraceae bacterium]